MNYMRRLLRWNREKARNLFYPEELAVAKKLSFRERVPIAEGCLGIYSYPCDDDGVPIREKGRCLVFDSNLIVNAGRASLAALQRGTYDGGVAFGVYDLGYLAVGNGSGSGGVTPQPTDPSLAAELTGATAPPGVIVRPSLSCTTPPPGPPFLVNLWSAQIGPSELNGYNIDEAALYCLDTVTMFSYRTFAAQAKSAGITFEFRWSILT
jgi:hypothetical protein